MRRLIALQSCLALAVAFFLAPFQHVHHDHDSDDDHSHSALIHTHFYAIEVENDDGAPHFADSHDEHAATSLDTFTVVPTAGFVPFVPPPAPVVIPVPSAASAEVAVVEERGHDPPTLESSPPRAPPV